MTDGTTNVLPEFIKEKLYSGENYTLILLNSERIPVAAIYLQKVNADISTLAICETNTSEKYYLYINGIAIFFSYFRFEKN